MCLAAAGLISGLASAASTFAGASARSRHLKAQAKFADRQADLERDTGAVDAARRRRSGARQFGRQVAQFARGGIALDGSPRHVLSDIEAETELDADRIRLGARARADQQRFAANLNRSRARTARQQGILDTVGPVINSFSRFARTLGAPQ